MTADEISTLKRGHAMDVEVALHVMGWHFRLDKNGYFYCWDGNDEAKGHGLAVSFDERTGQRIEHQWWEYTYDSLPNYSTRISKAWKVVERMRAKNWQFRLQELALKQWQAAFLWIEYPNMSASKAVNGIGGAAPEAICRAALLASI